MSEVVVGAGLAGLTAAIRLAEAGRSVTLLAVGIGGLPLSPGVIDVAGYVPDRIASPRDGVRALAGNGDAHPYARLGIEGVERAVEWIRAVAPELGLTGDLERNLLLPSAAGVARPTALAPETMAAGDVRTGARYLIAGFRVLKDLHPRLVADNLAKARPAAGGTVQARSVVLASNPRPGQADVSGVVFARAMDEAAFRTHVADELRPLVAPGEIVGVPAVIGLQDAGTAWRHLQDALGAPVFEIPMAPPSIPGLRLYEVLAARLRRAGARMILGAEVCGVEVGPQGIAALRATAAGRDRCYPAAHVVLATGGFASGAITVDSYGRVRERALDLPLAGVPDDGSPLFDADYWADHSVLRAGLAVDAQMRPVGPNGRPVHPNLYTAGAMLAGAAPWREKSGEGIAIASGLVAAEAILEEAA